MMRCLVAKADVIHYIGYDLRAYCHIYFSEELDHSGDVRPNAVKRALAVNIDQRLILV